VRFKNRRPGGGRINHHHQTPLRRVVVKCPRTGKTLILATNDFKRSALEIAELYRQRWGIELFFKWLKQNLKIKRFLGRSENAVKIQLYTALIAYVLVHRYRQRHGITTSLNLCLVSLKTGLFQRPEVETELLRRRRRARQQSLQTQGVLAL
jgi:IS4 transposase